MMALACLFFFGGCALVLSPWEPGLTPGLICGGLGLGFFFDERFNS
jgi:hypothetical protein